MDEKRVACVTGASRGIGKGIARALAGAGFKVVIHYNHNREAAQSTLEEITSGGGEGIIIQADLGAAAERGLLVDQIKAQCGRVDVLVNNAGMAPRLRSDLLEMSEASFDEVMSVNLKGPFFLTQTVAKWMLELASVISPYSPMIINIGSVSAFTASINRGEYCISKAGMGMMTMLFADRLAEAGIRVFELRPGIIETDMTAAVRAKYDGLIAGGLLPIKRWGTPEDIARMVAALTSGILPYSTGEVINIDGGFHIRRL